MSSDCFDVRIRSIDGAEVVFDVLTGTAGGYDDCFASRSFALLLLRDAMDRAGDSLTTLDEDARYAEAERMRGKYRASPLGLALANEPDAGWYVSADWMRRNVERFVAQSTLIERRNHVDEETLRKRSLAIEAAFGGSLRTDQYHLWQPRRWEQCHNYTLRVVAADPSWIAHLEAGVEFGTTAFDVWDDQRAAPEPTGAPPRVAKGSKAKRDPKPRSKKTPKRAPRKASKKTLKKTPRKASKKTLKKTPKKTTSPRRAKVTQSSASRRRG